MNLKPFCALVLTSLGSTKYLQETEVELEEVELEISQGRIYRGDDN